MKKKKEELEAFVNDFPSNELAIDKNTGKIKSCYYTLCKNCIFRRSDFNCKLARIEWAAQEFKPKPKEEEYFSVGKKAYLILDGEIQEGIITEINLPYDIEKAHIFFQYEKFSLLDHCQHTTLRMISICDIKKRLFLNKKDALKEMCIIK